MKNTRISLLPKKASPPLVRLWRHTSPQVLSAQPTMIVNNSFRLSHSVYNSWQHLRCGDGRALLTTAVVWRQVDRPY